MARSTKILAFTLIDFLIAVAILIVMAAALTPMMGSFSQNQSVEISIVTLLGGLREARQFARVQRDGYRYYGFRFYNSLGEDGDRQGYKILRYEPIALTPPFDPETQGVTVIKSPDSTDSPEFLDTTYFSRNVTLDVSSDFQTGKLGAQDVLVFTPEGSVTTDGQTLLDPNMKNIVLSISGKHSKSIIVESLTGYVRIQDN